MPWRGRTRLLSTLVEAIALMPVVGLEPTPDFAYAKAVEELPSPLLRIQNRLERPSCNVVPSRH
jgi:hypothetical protein